MRELGGPRRFPSSILHSGNIVTSLGRHASSVAFLVALIATAVLYFGRDHNADWQAYRYLYEEGGGWLAEGKRDLAFLALSDAAVQVLDYETFRIGIGLYFVGFTLWLANRWRSLTYVDRYFVSYLPLAPLLLPRFAVQIREGLAMTLVLLALTYLANSRRWRALVLLLVAGATHAAALTFLPLMVLPWVLRAFGRHSRLVWWVLILLGFGGFTALFATGAAGSLALALADSVWGDFAPMPVETSAEKAVYWLARSLLTIYLIVQARSALRRLPVGLTGFVRALVFVALPSMNIIALFLIFGGYSAYVASSALRVISILSDVALALVAMQARKTPTLLAVVALSIADEIRVLLANAPINQQ